VIKKKGVVKKTLLCSMDTFNRFTHVVRFLEGRFPECIIVWYLISSVWRSRWSIDTVIVALVCNRVIYLFCSTTVFVTTLIFHVFFNVVRNLSSTEIMYSDLAHALYVIQGGFTYSMPCPCRSPALLQQCCLLRESPRGSRKYPNC